VYDVVLYLWRSATFELPQIGGRARGRQRPRAPSLKERPDGHRRRFSVAGVPVPTPSDLQESDGATNTPATTSTSTATSNHKRKITATMSRPIFEFADDDE
jgi:microcystin-dependent protein